ncbi:hypothetical protein Leryth_021050 [Lithospermum erythrorhizon]|nr:hypothetical protein Leryth_021050 [Lithospermum erythrorhizon]
MADSEDYDGLKILETNGKEFRDLLQSEKHSEETCVIFRSKSTCTDKLIIHHRSERLIPIIDWAEKEKIDIVVHCANYAESRLTEKLVLLSMIFSKNAWMSIKRANGKCSRIPKDFRHLLNFFKDIRSQGRQCFHPALLRYHPSILVRRELSNFANEVFLKIRHNSNFTKKIIGQLDIVFQKYRGYIPPMNFSQWHTHKVTPSIDAIITKLGKTETCPDFKNYRVRYLLFIRDCIHHCDGDKDTVEQDFFAIYPNFLPVLFHIIIKNGWMEGSTFNKSPSCTRQWFFPGLLVWRWSKVVDHLSFET